MPWNYILPASVDQIQEDFLNISIFFTTGILYLMGYFVIIIAMSLPLLGWVITS